MQDLLERLENWLKKHRPDYASRLQPGLSSEEIAEIAAPLPFQLADEVIDLYHWHNGTLNLHGGFDDEFFQFYRFLPLQEAVEDTLMMRKYPVEQGFYKNGTQDSGIPDWQYYWFSIFYEVKERIITVGCERSQSSSSIIHFWVGGRKTWFYSLKGFISAVLECYESELYLLEDFCLDDAEEIWSKYRELGKPKSEKGNKNSYPKRVWVKHRE